MCGDEKLQEITEFLKATKKTSNKCLEPCSVINFDITQVNEAVPPLGTSVYNHEFRLPNQVKFYRAYQVYTISSILAEFGGWVGLFVGFCVIDVYKGSDASRSFCVTTFRCLFLLSADSSR